jgi:hypothetical protein
MTKSMRTSEVQWARLAEDANYGVRRGAWYRVAELTPSDAVVDVNRKPVALPRGAVKLRTAPPKAWTIVPRPRDARRLPENWADKYAVCPSCRNRAALAGNPQVLRCARCNGIFRVAWEEWFLAAAP